MIIMTQPLKFNNMKKFYLLLPTMALATAALVATPSGASVPPARDGAVPSDTVVVHDPAEWVSGTLPVLYVNTENGEDITSKDYYLQGTYYLDPMGIEGVEAFGSASKPLALQIKGRGNITWKEDKKPFRLKLDKKAALMGMSKSKHFVLLANVKETQCRCDLLAFELGRRLGMAYTPEMHAIELVINGDYRGLYYLCEKIRVDADHVNIVEQADEETDPEAITGGWLVEIDNYYEEGQICIYDRTHDCEMRFTCHTPEVLSPEQTEYITNFVTTVDNVVHDPDPTSTAFTDYIDLDALVRFYVIQEIMDNAESFSGSCYWHKERGADTKMVFGPLWDFGSSGSHWAMGFESFIYDNTPSYSIQHWIGELATYRIFQMKVREIWDEFKDNYWENLLDVLDDEESHITDAITRDRLRWPQFNMTTPLHRLFNATKNTTITKVNWLDQQWLPFNTYIAGSFTDWEDGKLAMTQASDGSFSLTVNGVSDGDEFRFIDYDGTTYGGPGEGEAYAVSRAQSSNIKLSADGQNFKVNGSGNLTFTLSPDMKLTITGWENESVTLAEALVGDEGDVTIVDNLAVVVANSNYAVVSDGQGNWLKVTGQNFAKGDMVSDMHGTLTGLSLNPVMVVSEYTGGSSTMVDVSTASIALSSATGADITVLKPNEVATFVGYYSASRGEMCASLSGDGLHITMTTDNMTGSISKGKLQSITGVVALKEAWDVPTGALARVSLDDDQAFENIQVDASSASTTTNIDSVEAIDDKKVQGIYNVNGQQVNRADKGVYIIRHTDGTVAKIRF